MPSTLKVFDSYAHPPVPAACRYPKNIASRHLNEESLVTIEQLTNRVNSSKFYLTPSNQRETSLLVTIEGKAIVTSEGKAPP